MSLNRPAKLHRCSFKDLIKLNVWRKVYADQTPVTVLLPWDSRVVQLNMADSIRYKEPTEADKNHVYIRNYMDDVAAIVVGWVNGVWSLIWGLFNSFSLSVPGDTDLRRVWTLTHRTLTPILCQPTRSAPQIRIGCRAAQRHCQAGCRAETEKAH